MKNIRAITGKIAAFVIDHTQYKPTVLSTASVVEWLACKFVGSNPAEAVGFFGRKIPQYAFLRRGSKIICPMSQLCGM